jgi:hypothetical protein
MDSAGSHCTPVTSAPVEIEAIFQISGRSWWISSMYASSSPVRVCKMNVSVEAASPVPVQLTATPVRPAMSLALAVYPMPSKVASSRRNATAAHD